MTTESMSPETNAGEPMSAKRSAVLDPGLNDELDWRKSSFSGANGDCVEVADAGELIAVRHSKEPEQGTIMYSRSELSAFIRGCKAGEFDDLARS